MTLEIVIELETEIKRLRNLCWDNGVCPKCGAKADCYNGNCYCTNCNSTKVPT